MTGASIDPLEIDEYIARGGYRSLYEVLTTMSPSEVCDAVETSGLRGRGGGGFPAGKKWKFAQGTAADQKYLICNADEGDPGAFMDRSIIESDPHSVIEGMTIGARAIGASRGFIYIRNEYPHALRTLTRAIDDARACGFLGTDILGSGLERDVGGEFADAVAAVNAHAAPVLALDIPTGLHGDSGHVMGAAVGAAASVMVRNKRNKVLNAAAAASTTEEKAS